MAAGLERQRDPVDPRDWIPEETLRPHVGASTLRGQAAGRLEVSRELRARSLERAGRGPRDRGPGLRARGWKRTDNRGRVPGPGLE